ncbi:MAG: alkaline phosphatase family protein [Actinomycetota bacterium]|nr:alkaline phosphatase family protein [Actinomycetota bacterium]
MPPDASGLNATKQPSASAPRSGPRRVVYIVVDGMSREALEQVTASGRAPALDFLRRKGTYTRDFVATFPTITPAATASLITGATPAEHGIPGMCWYDRDAQRFVNYGQSPRAAIVEGIKQVVEDFLENLNSKHLDPRVQTLHESLHELGRDSASVNYMIFRGPHTHRLEPNLIQRLLFRKSLPESLPGPKEHYFADVVSGPSDACSKMLSPRGAAKRIGATDGWAACVTRELLERDAADMILFYLHENDHSSHRTGPTSQVDSLAEADKHIAHVLDAFDSWERALEEVGWVVAADHSQTPIADDDDHILDFADLLDEFSQVKPDSGKEPFEDNDVACAGNGRVGFVYLNETRKERLRAPVVEALLRERGIDQVMWREGDSYVVRSDRGTVRFCEAQGEGVVDERGNKWTLEGELAAIDGEVDGNEVITPTYPLAMWRIKSALDLDRMGDLVVTTKLTYELSDLAGADHRGGGDHASLHAQDSIVPFISTLGKIPRRASTVDVAPHILEHFRAFR